MDAETKKTAVGNSIIATGLVAAALTFSVMNGTKEVQQAGPSIDEKVIVERVANQARAALKNDAETMVLTPDEVQADVMIWLNQYEKDAKAEAATNDGKLMDAIEAVASKVAVTPEPNERLMKMLETLTAKVTEIDSKNNETGRALDILASRVNNADGNERDAELTKVFEAFDGRISRFERIPDRSSFSGATINGGRMRLIADTVVDTIPAPPVDAELNARLARMEAMLAGGKAPPANAEGINVDWGSTVVAKKPTPKPAVAEIPPNTGAVTKDAGQGIVRTTARAAGETLEGGTDIATTTVNNVTNVAGRGVKDSVRTVTRLIGGTAETAGSTIGDTSSLATKQGKSIWKKFW